MKNLKDVVENTAENITELTKEQKKAIKLEAEKLKYEVAEELGLLEKVKETGWKGLTARETGQIGGIIAKKKRENVKK